MQKIILVTLLAITVNFNAVAQRSANHLPEENNIIPVQEYQAAVYASWLGQIIGNTYGLSYEFKFIDQPGPDRFPYGYGWTLDELRKYNGAFSDDDTDIEYMYLTQMEKNGIEPNYYQLANAWKSHVITKVWCANRAALTLMLAGHFPPVSGSKAYNTQWCQIDPQLVNEIWAVTAPGMIRYAVDKSRYTARITSDSFGLEPTLHYAAMYSAAFFEKDINKLIDIGTAALPAGSKFAGIVQHVKELLARFPGDWQSARRIVKDTYQVYADYNKYAWPPIDANLNGALGILALLYGAGDFQKTLDYCCAFGMDADNQAATMCGLLGIIYGIEGIPEKLMFPLPELKWEKPFNDRYKMITRENLPDATLSGMAERMSAQGEKIILAKGGKIIEKNGKKYYQINRNAAFRKPFELNPLPELYGEIGQPFSYPIYCGGNKYSQKRFISGNLPPGIYLTDSTLSGVPLKAGRYQFKIIVRQVEQEKSISVNLTVHSENLSGKAQQIIYNKNALNQNVEIIRDGNTDDTYYSTKSGPQREMDYYGYLWVQPQEISALSYNNGLPQEYCGWFTSFGVEYLQNDKWVKINQPRIYPEMNLDNSQWLKPHFMDYQIRFPKIKTKGIRIIGLSGGVQKDAANAHLGMQYFTAISELRVYAD